MGLPRRPFAGSGTSGLELPSEPPCVGRLRFGHALRNTVAATCQQGPFGPGGNVSTASILAEAGLQLPPGYTIVSADERPDLDPAIDELLAATWPAFMNEEEVANA